jgi:hypothetical protein
MLRKVKRKRRFTSLNQGGEGVEGDPERSSLNHNMLRILNQHLGKPLT